MKEEIHYKNITILKVHLYDNSDPKTHKGNDVVRVRGTKYRVSSGDSVLYRWVMKRQKISVNFSND